MKAGMELRGVSVAFATNGEVRPVLVDLDLRVAPGEWVAVIGRNGSGKSTLGKVLAGLCPVSRGTAVGTERVQMVFQNPEAQIVGETVYEDVCFGLENRAVDPAEMPARALAALRQVGLADKLHHSVTMLSGGQKQLLGIAGCLATEADAIVFDEATAMLDPASRARMLGVVQHLHRDGATVVWITQWLEELAYADRVIALEDGKIVYEGEPRDFFYEQAGESSPCERLGFVPPYTVQVAQGLRRRGVELAARPILPQELREAVSGR
jgi:energy-coupling factor transport system ATP-binding protein